MTDRDALLRAICDTPDDDAPRLVYADWLDENGDPRQAEFIRLQIAIGHLSDRDREKHPDGARLNELWRDLRRWRYVVGDWRSFSLSGFRRGFNTRWAGHILDFMAAAPGLWRLGPLMDLSLVFEGRRPVPDHLAGRFSAVEGLRWIERLQMTGRWLTDDWVETAVASPAATSWKCVRVHGQRLTDRSCFALATSALAKTRATVAITAPHISDEARVALFRAFDFRQSVDAWT